MLRTLKQEEFEQYAEFAFSLALDLSKSGYPTYTDGIKTKEDFIRIAKKALEKENEEILLFSLDGEVKGWIHYYFLPEDNYLSPESFLTESSPEAAVEEFICYVSKKYPGADLYMGFPKENEGVISALKTGGFRQLEYSYPHVLHLEKYSHRAVPEQTVRITKETYAAFAQLHDTQAGEMYWNSERIQETLEDWSIYAYYENGTPLGALYCLDEGRMLEIFGIDFRDGIVREECYRALMAACLNEAKQRGDKHLVYFAEEERELEILQEFGFHATGTYVCYMKKI